MREADDDATYDETGYYRRRALGGGIATASNILLYAVRMGCLEASRWRARAARRRRPFFIDDAHDDASGALPARTIPPSRLLEGRYGRLIQRDDDASALFAIDYFYDIRYHTDFRIAPALV